MLEDTPGRPQESDPTTTESTQGADESVIIWNQIHLPVAVKTKLQLLCKLFRNGDRILPKGVVLYGPPGTDKRGIARLIANSAGVAFIVVRLEDVRSDVPGESGAKVRALFEKAHANAPSVLLIEDVDAFTPRRGSPKNTNATKEIVSQWLVEQDELRTRNGEGLVFLVGATDFVDDVEQAVLIRLQKIEIPLAAEADHPM